MTMLVTDPGEVILGVVAITAAWMAVKAIATGVVRYAEIHAKRGTSEITTATEARLERIEQAMDAIAIEVERISENQRFTTKLLSERAGIPRSPDALISRAEE